MGSLGLGNGSLRMDDVYLEGSTPDGPAVVGHLSVIVDTDGITFLGPEPGERRTVGWERTSPLEFGTPAALPDGEAVTSLQFVVDGRPLRILVPSKRDPDGPDEEIAALAEPLAALLPEPPAAVLPEPPAAVLPEPPAAVLPEPPAAVLPEPPAAVLPEPPAAVLPEPPAAVLPEPPAAVLPEPPAAVLPEPPAAVLPEPPAAVLPEPPAAVLPEPPAAVSVEPPAAVFALPPPPPGVQSLTEPLADSPPVVPVIEDTFVVSSHGDGAPSAGDEPGAEEPEEYYDDELVPARPPVWFRYAPRPRPRPRPRPLHRPRHPGPSRAPDMVRLIVFTVLAGLIPVVAGLRYFATQGPPARIAVALSDTAIAAHVGIQSADLPGWATTGPGTGNPFAAGATTQGAAALSTAEQASTIMARCLHVPVSSVDGALGMGDAVSQRTAEVTSPSYADPAGNGGAVSSTVDVVQSASVQEADAGVFEDPALFATCYQPFVQAMLPFAPGAGPVGFATATVQPLVVPVPDGPAPVTVAAFQIARIANDKGQTKTVISTATAVSDGRVQATMGTVSNLVFSLTAQDQLVHDLEIRVIGVGRL